MRLDAAGTARPTAGPGAVGPGRGARVDAAPWQAATVPDVILAGGMAFGTVDLAIGHFARCG